MRSNEDQGLFVVEIVGQPSFNRTFHLIGLPFLSNCQCALLGVAWPKHGSCGSLLGMYGRPAELCLQIAQGDHSTGASQLRGLEAGLAESQSKVIPLK